MFRSIVIFLSIITFVVLGIVGIMLYQASPGPARQEILGVSLGSGAGTIHLSGRRLDCVPDEDLFYNARCTVEIAGELLIIQAARGGPEQMFGGRCQAIYAGQTWPCAVRSRHAHVHWFAHISAPLGLDGAQMTALRQEHYFENLPEEPFLRGMLIAPALAALACFSGWWAWQRPSGLRAWMTTVGLSLIVYISVFVLAFQLTFNFWD